MKRIEMLFCQLAEEASEVAQEAMKCNRFGPNDVYAGAGIPNCERVVRELNDMFAVLEMLRDSGVIPADLVRRDLIDAKKAKVRAMLALSRSLGTLDDSAEDVAEDLGQLPLSLGGQRRCVTDPLGDVSGPGCDPSTV